MIKLYGSIKTRSYRNIWALRELALEHEVVPVTLSQGMLEDQPLAALNPNGRVPILVDGDFVIWESLAINVYLAKRTGGPLSPTSIVEDAKTLQWCLWAVTEIERPLFILAANLTIFPDEKDETEVANALRRLDRPLRALSSSLTSNYLLGDRFTIVDLNVASVLAIARMARIDLGDWPQVDAYLDRCLARPAAFDPHEVLAQQPRPPHWADLIA